MWALFLPLVFAARNSRKVERCSWHLTPCADVCGAEPTFEGGLTSAIICSLSFKCWIKAHTSLSFYAAAQRLRLLRSGRCEH
jgi:hypothetical protein